MTKHLIGLLEKAKEDGHINEAGQVDWYAVAVSLLSDLSESDQQVLELGRNIANLRHKPYKTPERDAMDRAFGVGGYTIEVRGTGDRFGDEFRIWVNQSFRRSTWHATLQAAAIDAIRGQAESKRIEVDPSPSELDSIADSLDGNAPTLAAEATCDAEANGFHPEAVT